MDGCFLFSIMLCCSGLFARDRHDFFNMKITSLLVLLKHHLQCRIETGLPHRQRQVSALVFRISSLTLWVVTNGTLTIFPLEKMCNNYIQVLLILECDRMP